MKVVLAGAFGNLGAEILKALCAGGHELEWSSGFPYFLQLKSEFGNKEFMI